MESTYTSYIEPPMLRHAGLHYSMIPSLLSSSSLIKDIREMAFATVLAVGHSSHEDTSSALYCWSVLESLNLNYTEFYLSGRTFSPQALDLAIPVHLVVLEHSQLGLLALVFDLLGSSVHLLLALLGTTT